jgi:hypothetical protein
MILTRAFFAGAFFVLAGGLFTFFSTRYPMGTVHRMGPGWFPTAVASFLILVGAVMIAIEVVDRKSATTDDVPAVPVKSAAIIAGAIATFALTVRPLGLLPSTFLLVIISMTAHSPFRIGEAVLLAAGLSAAVCILFSYLLGMPFPILAV